jgi:ribosomal protein S18 acetylase RimI-like enzyme
MTDVEYHAKPKALRCSRCGRFVDWTEARLQVICSCRPHFDLPPVLTRPAGSADRPAALDLLRRDFGVQQVFAFGELVDLDALETVVADMQGEIAGVLAYRRKGDTLQIVALGTDPMWQRAGVGAHLISEVELLARHAGVRRIQVSAGNDNLPALYFYQRHGYRITDVVPDAFAAQGHHTTGVGFAEIPVRDELRLEKGLVDE